MRISDWSSDVCSSDLFALPRFSLGAPGELAPQCAESKWLVGSTPLRPSPAGGEADWSKSALELVADRDAVAARWHQCAADGAAGRYREAAGPDQFIGQVPDPQVDRQIAVWRSIEDIDIKHDVPLLRQPFIVELGMVLPALVGEVGAQRD